MKNITKEVSPTTSFFHRHLLGESIKGVLIRLTVILSAIIVVWCGLTVALFLYTKYQRSKPNLKTSITQHHLYDSNTSLTRKRSNRFKHNHRFSSSLSTFCNSVHFFLSQLKRHCVLCPSSLPSSTGNEDAESQSSSLKNRNQCMRPVPSASSHSNSNQTRLAIEAMTKRSLSCNYKAIDIEKKLSSYRGTSSSNGNKSKNFCSYDHGQLSDLEVNPKTSNTVQLVFLIGEKAYNYDSLLFLLQVELRDNVNYPLIPSSNTENKDYHQPAKRPQKLNKYHSNSAFSFKPITRHLSTTTSCFLLTNRFQKQQQRKPFLTISSTGKLLSNYDGARRHSFLDGPKTRGEGITSSSKHIPVVMITDTGSSNTNIVELETYEDKHGLMSNIEKYLSRELRTSYRPRFST